MTTKRRSKKQLDVLQDFRAMRDAGYFDWSAATLGMIYKSLVLSQIVLQDELASLRSEIASLRQELTVWQEQK